MELGPVLEPAHEVAGVFSVVMVCTGNICRSPGAERLLALELSQRDLSDALRIKISSAGVRGWDAAPMNELSLAALEARGGSGQGFASRPISESIVANASLILTATKEHRSDVVEDYPKALRKTFTMREFAVLVERDGAEYSSASELVAAAYRHRGGAEILEWDVDDPYGGEPQQHEVAMATIHDCMSRIADAIARCDTA